MFLVIRNYEQDDRRIRVINFKNITQFIVAPLGMGDSNYVIQAEVETPNRVARIFLSSIHKPFKTSQEGYEALKKMLEFMTSVEKRGGNFYNVTIYDFRSAEEIINKEVEDKETVLRKRMI